MPTALLRRQATLLPVRSPERQKLADSIERYNAAAQRMARIEAATKRAFDERVILRLAAENALTKLADARAAEPKRLTARLIGDPDPDAPTLADAETALTEANSVVEQAERTRDLLLEEEKTAKAALEAATHFRKAAADQVIGSSAALAALVAEYRAARERVTITGSALRYLGPLRVERWDVVPQVDQDRCRAVVASWEAAIKSLEVDPDAPLPGDDD